MTRTREDWLPYAATTWDDGSPMYDNDGYMTDPPHFSKAEDSQAALRAIKRAQYLLPDEVRDNLGRAERGLFGQR